VIVNWQCDPAAGLLLRLAASSRDETTVGGHRFFQFLKNIRESSALSRKIAAFSITAPEAIAGRCH
jgi:hypothetical protein